MHLQTVLFDVDGTLVDSNELHARCWIEAFAHFGKQFEYDEIFEHIGKGGDLLVPDLLDARSMQKFGEELQEYRGELFKKKYLPEVKPFPYAKAAMEELARRGVKLALASSSNEDEVEYHTRLLGVGHLLEGKTSKGDAEFSKPSPEIFRAALERADGDPERTLVVGDTPYDILAAHRAALPVVAVLSGGFPRETLTKAEFLFADVEEMVRKIDEVDAYFEHE